MSKTTIKNLPVELVTQIIENTKGKDFEALCNSSKFYKDICTTYYKDLLFLHRHQLDFKDPTNFIYVANKAKMLDYKKGGKWDYKGLVELYMKHYNKKDIKSDSLGYTSFPIYPNMIRFYGDTNDLTSFPVQPNMVYFRGNSNYLKSFPTQPKMEIFIGNHNKLSSFPVQPKMRHFQGIGNKLLTSFPIQPEMEYFLGNSKKLKSYLKVQPKLKI